MPKDTKLVVDISPKHFFIIHAKKGTVLCTYQVDPKRQIASDSTLLVWQYKNLYLFRQSKAIIRFELKKLQLIIITTVVFK